MSFSRRALALPMFTALAACSGAHSDSIGTESVESSGSELIVGNPGGMIGNPLAATDFGWSWSDLGAPSDPAKCRGCSTTPNLAAGGEETVDLPTLDSYSIAPWQGGGGLPATYRQAVAASKGRDAAEATAAFENVDGTLEKIRKDIQTLCDAFGAPECVTKESRQQPWVRAFPRVQGRFRQVGYVRGADGFDRLESYANPTAFAEQRMRGAKSYCAMRSAAYEQGTPGADPYVLYDRYKDRWLEWTLGKAGASVKVLPPEKFTDDRGSESFFMPIAISSRISPIDGPVFPRFGELSHNLTWISGDREVLSAEDLDTVREGVCVSGPFGPRCIPYSYRTYRNYVRNLEHVDVMSGTENHGTVTLKGVVLMTWGFFNVMLDGKITIDSGVVSRGEGRVGYATKFPFLSPRSPEPDAYGPTSTADAPIALNGDFQSILSASSVQRALPGPAMSWRWRNDDDRAFVISDIINEDVTISANLGVKWGPVSVALKAASTLGLDARQDVELREQLSLVDGKTLLPTPFGSPDNVGQTNLVVIPRSRTSVHVDPLTLTLLFDVVISVDLGFLGTIEVPIHWSADLYTAPAIALGEPDIATGTEAQRLRVGEFNDWSGAPGDGMSQAPHVYSHVPNRETVGFPAFPGTVAACLADTKPPPKLPPPPASHDPAPGPVEKHACVVGPSLPDPNGAPHDFPDEICLNDVRRTEWAKALAKSWKANSTDPVHYEKQIAAEAACLDEAAKYVCSPTSKRVDAATRSHLFDPSETARYGALVASCSAAFSMGASDATSAGYIGAEIASTLVPVKPCKADGTPVPPEGP